MKNLKRLLGSESNAKIVLTSFEHHKECITECTQELIVHSFIAKNKFEQLRNYTKGQQLSDWIITKEEFTECVDT